MIELQPDKGIPRRLLFMMAAMAGLTVANLYYNQPLLELMRADIGMGEVEANMVTVVTQAGYALGLCLIIPLGDLWSRRRIIVTCMVGAALMTAAIATATALDDLGISSGRSTGGTTRFFVSDTPDGFAKQERLFMGSEAGGPVEQIAIETY